MINSKWIAGGVSCLLAMALWAQEAAVKAGPSNQPDAGDSINKAAIVGAKQDPASVMRGGEQFRKSCGGCHGMTGKGGPGAPNLVRSILVLDDEKGLLIGPVIREGRPDKGMPAFNFDDSKVADIVAWLHVRTYAAGHRNTYTFGNVVTGNAAEGKAYFDGAGKCSTCHSVTGDLAGIGAKYDPFSLQGRWLNPRGGRSGAAKTPAGKKMEPTVTVTLAPGEQYSGTLDHIDDFTVAMHDDHNQFHSFSRDGDSPKVVVTDPLQAHSDLLHKYSDADIHNITAYLVTLK